MNPEDVETLYGLEVLQMATLLRMVQVRNRHRSFEDILRDVARELDVQL